LKYHELSGIDSGDSSARSIRVRLENRALMLGASPQERRIMRANISDKLREIVAEIDRRGNAELTRLTVLKKWFGVSSRLSSFAIFVADRASRRMTTTSDEAAELFREARTLLEDVNVFAPKILRAEAARLHANLRDFQNEHRNSGWTTVRLIHDPNLYLLESGLYVYVGHGVKPTTGYRLTADYCEHYDPRYGNGLNGPSRGRIGDVIEFVEAIEAREARESN